MTRLLMPRPSSRRAGALAVTAAAVLTPLAVPHAADAAGGSAVAYTARGPQVHGEATAAIGLVVGGRSVSLHALPGPAGSSRTPVGWVAGSGRRLLARADGSTGRTWFAVLDTARDRRLAQLSCVGCDLGVAADASGVIGRYTAGKTNSTGTVTRYDARLHRVSNVAVRGLPKTARGITETATVTLAAVRRSGLVLIVPDPHGTSAYGGPDEIWTVDWSGRAHHVRNDPGNAGVGWATMSPDGRHLAYTSGTRAGACGDLSVPRVLDLKTGNVRTAPPPGNLRHGAEVFASHLRFQPDGRLVFAQENSGVNGDWSTPCTGSPRVAPAVYRWRPGSPLQRLATRTLDVRTLPDRTRLTLPFAAPGRDGIGWTRVRINGRAVGPQADEYSSVLVR